MRFALRKQERIRDLEISVAYFASANKPSRERDTVDDLLRNLGTRFRQAEIESVPASEEPPDVKFRSATFEVKEILDEGRKRDAEYKALLEAARKAKTFKELWPISTFRPRDISVTDLLEEVGALSDGLLCRKYPAALARTLDLLVYYDRIEVMGLVEKPFPSIAQARLNGWRSVSVLMGHRAIVFLATPAAPQFLRHAVGQVRHRPVRKRA